MNSLSTWILSIAGIVCISVIVEIIMPDGQMNKYIKGIISFIIIFVIISPLPNLLSKKSLDINPTVDKIEVQQDFIDSFNLTKKETYEEEIKSKLVELGYENVFVHINLKTDGENCYFNNITVDLSNLVIKENAQHKNILEIKEEILGEVLKIIKDAEVCFEE